MEQAYLVARQVLLIFIYIGIGIVCTKVKILDEKSGRNLSNFSLYIVTPVLIMRFYARPLDMENLSGMGVSFVLALVFHLLASLAALVLIRKRDGDDYKIERLAVIFSNCGYVAIPLIRVTAGEIGVFYALSFICVFNICVWSVGIIVLTGQRKIRARMMFLNPGFIGFIAGMAVYFMPFSLPPILLEAMDSIMAFNTPLPMITIGIFLSTLRIRDTFLNPRVYYVAILKMIVFPLAMLSLMKLSGISTWMPGFRDIALAIGLGCACPSAAAVTLLPASCGMKGDYGASIIAVTTLVSILTLPLITLVINAWL